MPYRTLTPAQIALKRDTLLLAAVEFGTIYPCGSKVLVRDNWLGLIIEGISRGTSSVYYTAGLSLPKPRIRLPDGSTIAIDVTSRRPRYSLVEPLPAQGGRQIDAERKQIESFLAHKQARIRHSHTAGDRRYRNRAVGAAMTAGVLNTR